MRCSKEQNWIKPGGNLQRKRLQEIEERIKRCKRCELWKTRINAVPGEGPPSAKIFFLAQNPGRNEDVQGRPFVGLAGKFLEKLLSSIGLKREEVFITGVVKCHTPGNREPTKREIEACKPYTLEQIETIKPHLVVILGNVALKALFPEEKLKISEIHGKQIEKEGRIYFPTFHPAAAMRFPSIRKLMEEDFKKLKIIAEKFLY